MIAIPFRRVETNNRAILTGLALMACVLVGVCAVIQPLAAVALAGLLYVCLRGQGLFRDGLMLILIGNMTLNYGFANIGVRAGPLPLPLTDVTLLAMVVWCFFYKVSLRDIGVPAFFMIGILTLATVRLVADFPTYGNLAVRDYTTSMETTAIVVGFCAYRMYGLKWANRFWLIASLAVLSYAMLFPLESKMLTSGINVGLQQPVPLFGNYAGMGAAAGTAFLYFMLRVKAPLSLILGAIALGTLMLFQARGIYLGVPMAILIVVVLGDRLKTRIWPKLLGTLAVGVVLLLLVTPLGLKGRMGPVTLSFVTSQFGTLFGQKGPGDGSYDDRLKWLRTVREKQEAKPVSLVWGLGLGPDLTGGATGGVEFIRKPHNDYVEIFARFGFLGALLWAGFLGSLSWALWRGMKTEGRSRNERTFLLWIIASLVLYLFISATQPQLAYAYGTLPVFVLFGMGLALVRSPIGVEKDPPPPHISPRKLPVFVEPPEEAPAARKPAPERPGGRWPLERRTRAVNSNVTRRDPMDWRTYVG